MELRIREIVGAADADAVLSLLEQRLAPSAQIVDRHQGIVTAFGIGSSAFGFREADIGFFEVLSEPSRTVIAGLVHYDEEAAKARTADCFEPSIDQRIAVVLDSIIDNLGLTRLEPRLLEQNTQHSVPDLSEEIERYAAKYIAHDQVVQSEPPSNPLPADEPTRLSFPLVVTPRVAQASPNIVLLRRARPYAGSIAAAVLATVAAGAFLHHVSATRAHQPASPAIATTMQPAAKPPSTQPETAAAFNLVSNPTLHVRRESSLNQWATDWITALRSRDPDAQASFYSDRVDQYRGHHAVTRDDIARDRKAALQSRQHLWTIRLEGITVEKQTASKAALHLRTRVIERTPQNTVAELWIVTDLRVRNVDGVWKIFEEADHAAA